MKKIFTLWRIITSNIMMMKKLLFSSFFLLGSLVSQAQHEYTIKGEVKGVKDGTHVSLFLTDGRVGSIVGTDTIRNGTFFFKRNAGESGMDQLSLMSRWIRVRMLFLFSLPIFLYVTVNGTGENTVRCPERF